MYLMQPKLPDVPRRDTYRQIYPDAIVIARYLDVIEITKPKRDANRQTQIQPKFSDTKLFKSLNLPEPPLPSNGPRAVNKSKHAASSTHVVTCHLELAWCYFRP
ncbi:unnamed protein product [Linum trigynum]|uniref:Uncharacterized protein n=1 Tax=Linum trigynum TaxID=586398 RepID=A0AAV2D4U1_9ROSI